MKKSFIIFSQSEKDIKNDSHVQLCLPLEVETVKKRSKRVMLEKPCPQCDNQAAKVGAGRRPGESSLGCSKCKRFIKWIPNELLEK